MIFNLIVRLFAIFIEYFYKLSKRKIYRVCLWNCWAIIFINLFYLLLIWKWYIMNKLLWWLTGENDKHNMFFFICRVLSLNYMEILMWNGYKRLAILSWNISRNDMAKATKARKRNMRRKTKIKRSKLTHTSGYYSSELHLKMNISCYCVYRKRTHKS